MKDCLKESFLWAVLQQSKLWTLNQRSLLKQKISPWPRSVILQIGGCFDTNPVSKKIHLNASTLLDPLSLISFISLIGHDISSFSVLVDSGSSNYFIDTTFVNNNSLQYYFVPLLQLWLFNRTTNSTITQAIKFSILFSTNDITPTTFYVTLLDGSCFLVLGHNWHTLHNLLTDCILSSILWVCSLEQTSIASNSKLSSAPSRFISSGWFYTIHHWFSLFTSQITS